MYSWSPLEPDSPFTVQDQLHTLGVFETSRQTQATVDTGQQMRQFPIRAMKRKKCT